jgi:hypothetical protein
LIRRIIRRPAEPVARNDSPTAFILDRELSEVHLLIDYISSDALKCLPEAVPDNTDHRHGHNGKDWVEKVCKISWPPEGTRDEKASQAALLVHAKDALNRLAYPASGATVAFTLLVAQEDDASSRADLEQAEKNAPSRISLARSAYPNLISKAKGFRTGMAYIRLFLIGWLILTCLLSWYLAIGNSILAQLTTAQTAQAALLERMTDADNGKDAHAPGSGTPPAGQADAPLGQSTPVTTSTLSYRSCRAPKAGPGAPTDKTAPGPDLQATSPLCDAAFEGEASILAIQKNLAHWLFRPAPTPLYPISPSAHMKPDSLTASAATLASLLGTGILPVFYGILGAGAAAVRLLFSRMKASQLWPRDIILSVQLMSLGAVVGACIGLFVNPSATATQGAASLLGPVALSGSALSFIAGFGVEYVFAAMEALLRRIFATTSTPPPVATGR